MKKNKGITYIVVAIVLYIVSTGVSFAVFKALGTGSTTTETPLVQNEQGHFVIDPSLPKTEACPINGQMFTKLERDIWEKRRPLAVMIENHVDARPQTGLSYADVVYEAVAEGGITRFMGVYYCGIAAYNIGFAPVRSARTYYVDWVSEYDALYNHVGGAGRCNDDTVDERAKALCQIDEYGIKDMDQFGLPFKVCRRNENRLGRVVAWEHTVECFSNELYNYAQEKYDWTNVDAEGVAWDENFDSWTFKDDAKEGDRGTVSSISFVHWEGYDNDFGVQWNYDSASNSYKRVMGGQPHVDFENKQQLIAKNVVIQMTREIDSVDEHAHVLYDTIGTGKALIFQDGDVIVGTWKKPKRTARTKFYDAQGKEVALNRGPVWIEVMSNLVDVTY
ncbi:DUF3048 domain-containing protein [Candidatus Microgenomates bacterium]|nr:MAG: DUF3048 domain-containing protein [Candidatus Microgenomates bacterium]